MASSLMSRRVEQQLKGDEGLSHPQYEVLVRLSATPDAAPGHVALVRELFIDALEPGQIALLADALETVGHRLRGDAPPPPGPPAR
ncbi:hypothetical protein [Streptomyces sp. NBC_00691]|uniref:hypothetical protein n=1 Tax=Streptomyces sp. NBC_00691 TaxID=2903671 RepID=UPI002E37AF22|nr:hypothetical protein [Streptomyces sp. NBC_00691]